MKKRKLFIAFMFLLSMVSNEVLANTNDNVQPMGGFSIEGIPNSNQIDMSAGYFHLYEKPSEEDQIRVKLINDSSQDKSLSVKVVDANTNITGNIDYTGNIKNNPRLTLPLTSILKVESSEVVVPKHSNIETSLNLKMPPQTFEGIILGGIVISESQQPDKNNAGVSNTYSYTLGVVLTNTKTTEMKKNIDVTLDNVEARLSEGKKVIEADILNNYPFIFSRGNIQGTIREKEGGKVIKKVSKDNVSIAPYSIFPLQFDWQKKQVKSGKYIFSGQLEDGQQTWKFEKEFVISSEQAKKINNDSVYKIFIPMWLKFLEFITLLFTMATLAYNFKGMRK